MSSNELKIKFLATLVSISAIGLIVFDRFTTLTYSITIIDTLPHDKSMFTEGFSIYNNNFIETTGKYSESMVLSYPIADNSTNALKVQLNDVFGEGSVVLNNKLYMLTWQDGKVLIIDPDTLKLLDTALYSRDGWGLTTDGKSLIASDGTSNIYYMDEELNTVKTISVRDKHVPVTDINELEYIDNYIWANVWNTDNLIIIDPGSGDIIQQIDMSDLYVNREQTSDCMNGIAWDGQYLYLTGKYWPYIYKCKISTKIQLRK